MKELEGKKVLFVSAYFFGYNKAICSALESMGASVDYYDERPANTFFVKAMIRMRPELIKTYIQKYHNTIIEQTKQTKYDYIFFIKAESITPESLSKLKKLQPQAKMVLYLWDSLDNFRNGEKKLSYFDRRLSFDRSDCLAYDMIFRPLFYTMDYASVRQSKTVRDIDVLFIGTMHSDRYQFVERIRRMILAQGGKAYYYLFFMSKILYYKMKWSNKALKGKKMSDFKFKSITQDEILKLFDRTKSVIDIQHPKQTGLTMRTLEVLGAGRKLITTNADVVNYDFYNPNNITVVDRMDPIIPEGFMEREYTQVPEDIYDKYSIYKWLKDIFGIW